MLSNAYFLAKFRFDTAENEPAKNLQNLPILLTLTPNQVRANILSRRRGAEGRLRRGGGGGAGEEEEEGDAEGPPREEGTGQAGEVQRGRADEAREARDLRPSLRLE